MTEIDEISVTELRTLQEKNENFLLLDVREPFEYDICNLGGKLMPLQELPLKIAELDQNQLTIIHCRSGGRSKKACEFLKTKGFTKIKNLTGGILAWREKMDPTMTKY